MLVECMGLSRGGGGGGGGGGGKGGLDPPEKHKNIGFFSNTGPDGLKNLKATIQCWAIIGPPAKCHLNGVLLEDR